MDIQDETDFEEVVIDKVSRHETGWTIEYDHCGFGGIPLDTPIEPKAGMTARFVPGGLGHRVRGLALDGVTVFYRTKEQDDEHFAIAQYGKDAAEWVARWDKGDSIWSIEMGGFGPGYEQALQIAAVEMVRHMLAANYDPAFWSDKDQWKADREKIDRAMEDVSRKLGLSGAQYGAALNIACQIYQNGPRAVMSDERVKDRKILVSKDFPHL